MFKKCVDLNFSRRSYAEICWVYLFPTKWSIIVMNKDELDKTDPSFYKCIYMNMLKVFLDEIDHAVFLFHFIVT